MNEENKIFCGSGKGFSQYETINLRLTLDDIPQEFITEYNGKRQVRLVVKQRQQPSDKGDTHYVIVNQWKPNKQTTDETPF